MARLLTDKELHSAREGDSLSTVARARTLTVLGRLDPSRKRIVLQFLYESRLIHNDRTVLHESDLILEKQYQIVNAHGIDLSGADLRFANPIGANLSGADLRDADLSDAVGVTNEQLSAAASLEGATMPDGQTLRGDKTPNGPTLEDWIKNQGRK
jgi:uncharacterized protein YjbI with pentapeptide repeats